jgi:hypothetical protein
MTSIRDILMLRDVQCVYQGVSITLRRPSAIDLIDALVCAAEQPTHLHAWLVCRHLVEDGVPVYDSVPAVLALDARRVSELAALCEALYSEGRD